MILRICKDPTYKIHKNQVYKDEDPPYKMSQNQVYNVEDKPCKMSQNKDPPYKMLKTQQSTSHYFIKCPRTNCYPNQ